MTSSRLVTLWLPVVVWAGVIFTFSSIPGLATDLGVWDTILRKCAHVTEYAILGALLLRALGRELPAFALGLGYAITDEIHQHFVQGRHGAPLDVAIDAGGLLVGILILRSATARVPSERRLGWNGGARRIERDG